MYDTQGNVGPTTTIREAVGVFRDPASLQEAIDELLSSGFDRAEVSLLAGEHAVEEKLGHRYRKAGGVSRTTRGCHAPLTSHWNPSVMRRAA